MYRRGARSGQAGGVAVAKRVGDLFEGGIGVWNGLDLEVFRQREIGVAGWFDLSC